MKFRKTTSISHKEWTSKLESKTLSQQPDDLRAARKHWQSLGISEQMALAREQVLTRAAELCRAYKNLISLSYGFKTKRVDRRRNSASRILRNICVTFVVKEKWQTKREEDTDEKLPPFLYAWTTISDQRQLCAIPTDVRSAEGYHLVRPQCQPIFMSINDRFSEPTGMIACAVTKSISGDPPIYVLSCRHVFSMTNRFPDASNSPSDVPVSLDVNSPEPLLASTTEIRGDLQPGNDLSFDAQLALVKDETLLGRVLSSRITKAAKTEEDISDRSPYTIYTGRGAVEASFVTIHPTFGITYANGQVFQPFIVESTARTAEGDSGSPVISDDGMFLGMHIAGKEQFGSAFMIPAWRLFNGSNYENYLRPRLFLYSV